MLIGVNLCLTEYKLKKQSQLFEIQIGLNSCVKGNYEEFCPLWATKKQSQSKPISVNRARLGPFGLHNGGRTGFLRWLDGD